MWQSYKILHLFNVWVYPESCNTHLNMYCCTCSGSNLQTHSQSCFIELLVGVTMYMNVATWSRITARPGTLLKVKFSSCDISTWHHELQLDKPSGQPGKMPSHCIFFTNFLASFHFWVSPSKSNFSVFEFFVPSCIQWLMHLRSTIHGTWYPSSTSCLLSRRRYGEVGVRWVCYMWAAVEFFIPIQKRDASIALLSFHKCPIKVVDCCIVVVIPTFLVEF